MRPGLFPILSHWKWRIRGRLWKGLCVAECKYKKGFVALLSYYLAFLQRVTTAAPVVFSGAVGEYIHSSFKCKAVSIQSTTKWIMAAISGKIETGGYDQGNDPLQVQPYISIDFITSMKPYNFNNFKFFFRNWWRQFPANGIGKACSSPFWWFCPSLLWWR